MEQRFTLPTLHFTAGETQVLIFRFFNKSKQQINSADLECTFSLIHYSQRFSQPLFVLNGEILQQDEVSSSKIKINSEETLNLFGKFVYQISIKDIKGNVEIEQGIMEIYKNTNV